MVTIIFSLGKSDAKIRGIFETAKLFYGKVSDYAQTLGRA